MWLNFFLFSSAQASPRFFNKSQISAQKGFTPGEKFSSKADRVSENLLLSSLYGLKI
jgi:hypothetical protein